jgi:hypothetical protein
MTAFSKGRRPRGVERLTVDHDSRRAGGLANNATGRLRLRGGQCRRDPLVKQRCPVADVGTLYRPDPSVGHPDHHDRLGAVRTDGDLGPHRVAE